MSVAYYRDGDGNFLGAFANGAVPGISYFSVSSPPAVAGMVWSGEAWVDSVASVRLAKQAALVAERNARVDAGYVTGGHTWAIDDSAISRTNGLASLAIQVLQSVEGASWDSSQTFFATDGASVTFATPGGFLNNSRPLVAWRLAIDNNYASISADIAAADTVNDVNAIDVTAGWPS